MIETDEFATIADVREYVRGSATRLGKVSYPANVADPTPLMERVVTLAGPGGITRQNLLEVFEPLGKERKDRALEALRQSERVEAVTESRPSRAGRDQSQAVFRSV
jgi:hypothetical protein